MKKLSAHDEATNIFASIKHFQLISEIFLIQIEDHFYKKVGAH